MLRFRSNRPKCNERWRYECDEKTGRTEHWIICFVCADAVARLNAPSTQTHTYAHKKYAMKCTPECTHYTLNEMIHELWFCKKKTIGTASHRTDEGKELKQMPTIVDTVPYPFCIALSIAPEESWKMWPRNRAHVIHWHGISSTDVKRSLPHFLHFLVIFACVCLSRAFWEYPSRSSMYFGRFHVIISTVTHFFLNVVRFVDNSPSSFDWRDNSAISLQWFWQMSRIFWNFEFSTKSK